MSGPSVRPGAATLWRDPVVLAILSFSVLAGTWYLLGWGGQHVVVVGFLMCPPLINVACAVMCRRVARMPGLPLPARRFWNAFAVGALCVGTGDLTQLVIDLDDPLLTATPAIMGTANQAGLVVGVGYTVWALLTLPNGAGSRREQLRFWLDASTVMAGAAAFAWYFSVSPNVGSQDAGALLGSVLVMGIELVTAFAVVKLLLTGAAGFVPAAAWCGAAGIGLDGLIGAVLPTAMSSPWLPLLVAAQMLPNAMIGLAPRIQEIRVRADPALLTPTRKRPYSLLPYLAIAATLALLIVVLADEGIETRVWGVLAGVVVSTALVVARQLAAFSENADLLTQLHASVEELGRQERLLRHQASHDHLTQLANRALFTERAEHCTSASDDPTAVIMIDLDDFKPINDTLGHHVGDAVLVAVAERLRTCVRPGDTVARLGGDEFAILLPTVTDNDATTVIDRITTALAQPVHAEGHTLAVHASIGLATGTSGDAEALLRAADHAMYSVKRTRHPTPR